MDSHDAYREIDAVNISTLKEMRLSPAHYVYRLANPREDSTGLAMGRACHTLILEPEKWDSEYVIFPGKTRRGKAWDEFAAAHEGLTILKADEYADVVGVRDAVMAHPIARRYLEGVEAEKVLRWKDKETGLDCKARLDGLSRVPAVVDLKGTTSTDARIFGSVAARMGYHLQGAFYTAGARICGLGMLPFVIIAVESDPPHDVAVFDVGEDELWHGEQEVKKLLQRVAECRASGKWPGRYEGEQVLRLPAWAYGEFTDDEGLDLTVNGQEVAVS